MINIPVYLKIMASLVLILNISKNFLSGEKAHLSLSDSLVNEFIN